MKRSLTALSVILALSAAAPAGADPGQDVLNYGQCMKLITSSTSGPETGAAIRAFHEAFGPATVILAHKDGQDKVHVPPGQDRPGSAC
jgi:hypothetical protein